jgi:glycosyltransferase involved in cell wall biosynthesis
MAPEVEVSAIIPTWNRRDLVLRAVRSVLAQTREVGQIVVVDDGSTDGTREALREAFGDRVEYHWQENAGVSAARNRGLAAARGRYLALLDSDDEWLPEKIAEQVAWLDARPEYGMVLCDVMRMNDAHEDFEHFRRRDDIPEDGWVLKWVLLKPSLAPTSAMLRRAVYEDVGGFDRSLRTAEDLDFHLRIARRWRIGVLERPLARAMRGHDGLSALTQTYDDYVHVIERAVADCAGEVPERDRQRALAAAYLRNARGLIMDRRWRDALALGRRAWRCAPDGDARRGVLGLLPFAARRALSGLRRAPAA